MGIKDKINEYCDNLPDGVHDIFFADGFDDAILGYDRINNRVVYSEDLVLETLMEDGMSVEDALEHYYYNIKGSYIGPGTPVFIKEI